MMALCNTKSHVELIGVVPKERHSALERWERTSRSVSPFVITSDARKQMTKQRPICPEATNNTRHTAEAHRNHSSVYAHGLRNRIKSCQPRLLLISDVCLRRQRRIRLFTQEVGGLGTFGQSGAIRGDAAFPKRGWMSVSRRLKLLNQLTRRSAPNSWQIQTRTRSHHQIQRLVAPLEPTRAGSG